MNNYEHMSPYADTGEPVFAVVGVLWKEGKLLAIPRKTDPNDLGLPGGKLDPGETAEEALIRELFEETGLTVQKRDIATLFTRFDLVTDGDSKPCRCYLVSKWEGELVGAEGPMPQWVEPSRLLEDSCTFRDYNRYLIDCHLEEIETVMNIYADANSTMKFRRSW